MAFDSYPNDQAAQNAFRNFALSQGMSETQHLGDDAFQAAFLTQFMPTVGIGAGIYNVMDPRFGAKGNGTTDDRAGILKAQTACGSAGTLLFPPGTFRVASDMTLTSAVTFLPGAVLKPDSGVTITIAGALSAGVFQIFDVSSGGTIVFGGTTIPEAFAQWWGGVCDGVADDSTAVHALLDAVKGKNIEGRVVGNWRVTSGYSQSTNYADVRINGAAGLREENGQKGVILLDSTDPASYFYDLSGRHLFHVSNVTFKCAQYVLDREFIKYSSAAADHIFENVDFESVEKPHVFQRTCYFQNGAHRNVQFRNSGTFHSKAIGTDLLGTLLVLENVNHEVNVPINSQAVVCDLTGIRQIQGENFLLEGALPAAGWTVLKLGNLHDTGWPRYPLASFRGYHSEWSGAYTPALAVDQNGGIVKFQSVASWVSATSPYNLTNAAVVVCEDVTMTGAAADPATFFVLNDRGCKVVIRDTTIRNLSGLSNPQIVYEGVMPQQSGSAGDDYFGAVHFNNTTPEVLWRWDGGYADADLITFSASGGSAIVFTTDTTYGRKMLLAPSGSALNTSFTLKARGILRQYDQLGVVLTFQIPTFTSGSILVRVAQNGVTIGNAKVYSATAAGSVIRLVFPFRVLDAGITSFALQIQSSATVGLTSPIEVYGLAFYEGNGAPREAFPNYPKQISTRNSAAPTTGTWAVGDYIKTTTPVVGSAKGWYCTVAGTQGTLSGVTGSITTGTTALTVNTNAGLYVGAKITIAGVTGTKTITAIADTAVTIDSNADATVSAAAVAYSAATFVSEGNL